MKYQQMVTFTNSDYQGCDFLEVLALTRVCVISRKNGRYKSIETANSKFKQKVYLRYPFVQFQDGNV